MNLKENLVQYSYLSKLSSTAESRSEDVYLVGGFVRDILLGRTKKEMDFLVVGDGPAFAKDFANALGINDIVIYKNFGTAHFDFQGMALEFVGARKESYKRNSRNPKVESGTLDDDLDRRDFTINTLAVSMNKENFGELVDKFNGIADIEKRIIKTPLDPLKTFDDDPLRIMRAFRFASQLNFEIESSVIAAATEMAERLKIVSQERITEEFLKILESPKPSVGLKLLYESGVMKVVFPEIHNLGGVEQRKDFHHKDVFYHTCKVVDNLANVSGDVWLRFAALVHDIAKPPTKRFVEGIGWTFHGHEDLGARMMKSIFTRLKLPLTKLEYIEKLVRLHLRPIALADEIVTDSAIRRLIVAADEDLEDLITLCRADITSKNPTKVSRYLENYEIVMQKVRDVKERDQLRAFQSPVRGEEIMQVCGIKPSKLVGDIKTAIEDAILDGQIGNNYEEAYAYFMQIKDEFLNK
ncbi:MAG: tRNA nucleotidyltransferase [Stygiobacter sp. RIFOXYA12_FULL_38_9]|nr:MAG: tRNA nucleotidyltransferase [Stygiobacter sp. GWC2_38_9]OGU80365.1 MAG: tRNA nucleotidyltransferase [Stygiobacter sp. RIFOXYA12_FULL_38_9]OGV06430.1 MAG: tRNA nucleotidyltransferase [Stygiobacter sp. RIFOXYB2_FULL_37_11]OGV14024.1 MAG: tRNA nucleotidyltransferase [Stygiobacter sp. RIFOXYC2_FULL_38_25]OGV82355.1 MAG: tRNA nucleotidyltransferase [Stygiobacter sp. GWF2_38_21]